MSTPRGIRNNNPGNIETGALWQGLQAAEDMTAEQAAETRFCVFKAPQWGIRAIARILITYQDKRKAPDGSPIDTVAEILERWAPPSENDTDSYVNVVRTAMGVAAGEVIDVHQFGAMETLVAAIIHHENGQQPYSENEIEEGLKLAGVVRSTASLLVRRSFSETLTLVQLGLRMRRDSWPDDAFIFEVPGSQFEVNRAPLLGIYPEGTQITYHSHVDICLDGEVSPWTPDQRDMAADDWVEAKPLAT